MIDRPPNCAEPWAVLERAGDYCGPVEVAGKVCVFFLSPIARDDDAPPGGRSIAQVQMTPHVFRECADSSLEIRESIALYGYAPAGAGVPPVIWHGYLDEGHVWRTC